MRCVALALAAFSLIAAPARTQPLPPPEAPPAVQPTLALEGGRWFDGERFVPDRWFAVAGRLTRARPERVDVVVDLDGRFVLPPLIDAHNHDVQSGRFGAISSPKNLRAGVFHSVQMCSRPDERADYAGFLGRPGTIDALYADACISSSDGHPLGIILSSARQMGMQMSAEDARTHYDVVDSSADLERLWPEIAARQPQMIKLILINSQSFDRGRGDPTLFGYLGLDPDLVAPIVTRAHEAGIRVVVHCDSAADFAVAVAAGADIIAHLPGYRIAEGMSAADYRLSADAVAEAARRGTIVITTTVVAGHDMARRPHNAAALRAMQIENLERLRSAGVPLAIGSDHVMGTVVDELLYLDELGVMPRAELLRRATAETARLMFPGRAIGAFREGAEASLVAYAADPTLTIETLRRPQVLVQQGSVLSLGELPAPRETQPRPDGAQRPDAQH